MIPVKQLINIYTKKEAKISCVYKEQKDKFLFNFINGAFCEIFGKSNKNYIVEFWDTLNNHCEFR